MSAIGQVGTAQAKPEVLGICGPEIIGEDETAVYIIVANDYKGPATATVDNSDGQTDITSATFQLEYQELDNPTHIFDFVQIMPLDPDEIDEDELPDDVDSDEALPNALDDADVDLMACLEDLDLIDLEDLMEDLHEDIKEKVDQGGDDLGWGDTDIDCPDATPQDPPFCTIGGTVIDAVVEALAEAIIEFTADGVVDCGELGGVAEDAALDVPNGVNNDIAAQFRDAITDQCEDGDLPVIIEGDGGIGLVDVTCEEAGDFILSVQLNVVPMGGKANEIEVTCVGEVDEGVITATPNKIEIVPALGSLPVSLIVVSLLDENGDPVSGEHIVTFTTDLCKFYDEDGIEDEDGDVTLESVVAALEVFDEFDDNHPESIAAVADWYFDLPLADRDDDSNDVPSVKLTDDIGEGDLFEEDDNLAVILLDCFDENFKPGVANVCFDLDLEDQDIDGCVKVTVVGPPAKVTATAAPATLLCGEKATIVVEVLDAANQPVSDHTRVEAVTNIGGVLAGTGAVAGLSGPVVPVSSTVGETFAGKSTFYLLTSDTHTGPYEVVIASGGGGSVAGWGAGGLGGVFSTPPQVTQVTVTCTQPVAAAPSAPAPTVTAPRTGTGVVTPPNTGDAGLADQSAGSSFALILVAGVVAFSVAGLATLKISRR
jgi:hypothetical protein